MFEAIKAWFIIVLIVVIICLLGYITFLFYRKRHTKERFAFYAVLTLVSLAVPILTSILSNKTLLGLALEAIDHFFKIDLPAKEPTFSDQALAVLLFCIMTYFLTKIHQNWNSEIITESQYKNSLKGVSTSILNDFSIQLKDFIGNESLLKLHNKQDLRLQNKILNGYKNKVQPWYENVAEIFTLLSSQYKINLEKDWYSEEMCFVVTYGKEKERLHIYCLEEEPTDELIEDFIKAINQSSAKVHKIVIAIEKGESSKEQLRRSGILIEKRYKSELLKSIVDFSSYEKSIKESFTKEQIHIGSNLVLSDVYVPSSGFIENTDAKIDSVEQFLITWTKEKSDKQIALLGNYGQGKSVLALKLAYELIVEGSERIPLLIVLRGKSPRNLSMLEVIATWASNFRIEPQAILKLHFEGKLLIIFEGFDEMDLIGDSEMRMNHFRSLWEFAKTPNSKILITGRPNFFLDDKELRAALGIFKPISISTPHSEAVYLNNFNQFQIEKALRNVSETTREGILSLTDINKRDKKFYELVSRPSTLFLVSSIWSESDFKKKKESTNSATVIREFILENYERQGKKGNVSPLTEKERHYFMIGIAVGMMRISGYSNQIDKDKLSVLTLNLLDSFPPEVGGTNSAFERARKPLKERLAGNEEIMRDSILTDVRSSGILVQDLSRTDHFKFAHKSFLEFLVSEYFVSSLTSSKNEADKSFRAISKSVNNNSTRVRKSREVKSFVSELISNQVKDNGNDLNTVLRNAFKLIFRTKIFNPWLLTFFLFHKKLIVSAVICASLMAIGIPAWINHFNYEKAKAKRDKIFTKHRNQISLLDSLITLQTKFLKSRLTSADTIIQQSIVVHSDSVNFSIKVKRDSSIREYRSRSAKLDSLVAELKSKVNDDYLEVRELSTLALPKSIELENKLEKVLKEKALGYLDSAKAIIEQVQETRNNETFEISLKHKPVNTQRVWLIIFTVFLAGYLLWISIRQLIERANSEDLNINDQIEIWMLTGVDLGIEEEQLKSYLYTKYYDKIHRSTKPESES